MSAAVKRKLTFEQTVSTKEPQKKQRNNHCDADTKLMAFASEYIPRKIKEETVVSAELFMENTKHVPESDDVNVNFDFITMVRTKPTKGQVTFPYIGTSIGDSFKSAVRTSKIEFHHNGLEAVILSFAQTSTLINTRKTLKTTFKYPFQIQPQQPSTVSESSVIHLLLG